MMKHAQQAAVAENVKMTRPATDSTADAHIAPAPRVSVQAFCETVETAAAVQAAGEDRRLAKAHVKIQMGGITAATEAYRNSPTPNVILIETDSRTDDILKGLDQLAEVCDSGTRVVVLGRVNDVRLYRELTRRGVSEYLMTPVGTIDVVRAVCNLFSAPDAKAVGRIIAVVGAKGGVGASTVAHNIAWAIGRDLGLESVVVDLDLAFGTAGLDYNQDRSSTRHCRCGVLARPRRYCLHRPLAVEMHGSPQPAGCASDSRPGL
jgi:pilus assembly protein CpaE